MQKRTVGEGQRATERRARLRPGWAKTASQWCAILAVVAQSAVNTGQARRLVLSSAVWQCEKTLRAGGQCQSCLRCWTPRCTAAPWRELLRLRLRGGGPDEDEESDDPDYAPAVASRSSDDGASDGEPQHEDGGASPAANVASASLQPGSSVLDESQIVDPSNAGEDSTDELLGGASQGAARMEEDEEEEEEEEVVDEEGGEREEEEEDEEAGFGDDEAVEEEVEESVPEQEKGEAREARLLAQKLRNRTDLKRERFQDVLKRYEQRERLKKLEARQARQRFTLELEQFLGIQPPPPPLTLHQRVCRDEGACAAPPSKPEKPTTASSGIRLCLDDTDTIEVSNESAVTMSKAVKLARVGQTIVSICRPLLRLH
jgi:hypothetical protein